MVNDLIYICTAILLPLIPAFVIYRVLNRYSPTTARVRGSPGLFGFLKGLKVDIRGAGASYFVLVLLIFAYIYTRPRPPVSALYSIEGRVTLNPPEAFDPQALQVTIVPPQVTVTPGGVFRVHLGLADSTTPLPTLVVSYPGHDRATVELDPESSYRTPNVRIAGPRIYLGDVVSLQREDAQAPPYKADAASPGGQ